MTVTEWTDAEYGRVQETMERPAEVVAVELGKSRAAIYAARKRIRSGWTRKKAVLWTPEEDAVIRSGQYLTAAELAKRLPGRSKYSVDHRRVAIGAPCIPASQKNPFNPGKRALIARTCRKCGLLLPARWFGIYKSTPKSDCRKCDAREAVAYSKLRYEKKPRPKQTHERKYARMAQALSLETATRWRQEYTEADHRVLADPSLTNLAKALLLKRSYSAAATQVTRNGYSSFSGIGDPTRDMWSIDNPNASRVDEITAALKQEFETAGVPFPAWDWDDEDLKETA